MSDIYKLAGQRIREIREKHNFTRDYVASKAGISTKFLYELENGNKGFSANTLFQLCKTLEVSSEYILNGPGAHVSTKEIDDVVNLFSEEEIRELLDILKQLHILMRKSRNN